jgi:thymidylate kinase
MLRSAQRIEHFLPKADVCLFLNVSEEVAFSRKDDIPSAEYLRERKARYLALAGAYDFHEVNADAPLEEVLSEARKVISPFLNATARVANLARGI